MKQEDKLQNSHVSRAYGKIILLGEHAVVYGYPSLAAGISKGVISEVLCPSEGFRVSVPQWNLETSTQDTIPLALALQSIILSLPEKRKGCCLKLHLEIPAGAGMGSSAAMSVSMIHSLLSWHGLSWPLSHINEVAFQAEKAFHGTPSGIDNTIATFGGFCILSDSRFPCPFPTYQKLTLSKAVANLLSEKVEAVSLVVVNTHRPRQTKAMIEKVRLLSTEKPDQFSCIMEKIGDLAFRGYECLVGKKYQDFGNLLIQNHQYLQELGVSCPELDLAQKEALKAGAMGAKLTGAGGGGCLIAFGPGKEDSIAQSCEKLGFSTFITQIGG